MADKEVTVKIKPVVDDDSEVKDLESLIKEMDNSEISLSVETDDTSLEDAEGKVDDLDGSTPGVTVDTDDSSVDDAEDKVDSLDGKEVTVSVGADTSSAEESISGLEEALTAVGAGVALAGMEQMVATAGNIQDSWNRLGLTFGEVTGQMQTDISEAVEHTGRSGALTRQYFNDMGIAGVTNSELLQQSFEALSGRAYQTGNSIESMEQKMKMIVMSGNAGARQLTQLGITTADLGRVMGVSADEASKMFKSLSQEERLRVLTQAMGDGKQANEMYKNSWQGLKDQMGNAMAALEGAIGSVIAPILVPVLQAATTYLNAFTEGFKALPAPIKSVIGVVGALLTGFLALGTIVGVIRTIESTFGIFKTTLDMVRWAQRLLNLEVLMNPYVLVAVAILALIAALWYLYNTNEEFRNGVNQLYSDLQRLASGDWHVVVEYEKKGVDAGVDTVGMLAKNDISQGLFKGLFGQEALDQGNEQLQIMLESWKQTIHDGMDAFWNDGTQGFLGWLGQISGIDIMPYLQGVWNGFMTIPQWVNQAEQQTVQAFQNMLGQVGSILDNIGARASSFGSSLISNLGSAASSAVSSFASGLSGLVSAAWAEFNDVLNAIYDFGRQAIEAARGIGQQITNAIWQRNSPGIVAHATFDEMEDSYKFLKMGLENMVPLTSTYSKEIVDAYNPNLNVDFGSGAVSGVSGGAGTVINNEFNFTFTDFIDGKERLIDLIIRTITDEINWDNDRAGRTV